MPPSFKHSSFCVFACLCSASWSFGSHHNHNVALPMFNQGNTVTLSSDYTFNQILGTEFATSFIGNANNLTLQGKGNSLTFSFCQAPLAGSSGFISATETLILQGFSKLLFDSNQASGENGMFYSKDILFTDNKNLVFLNNKSPYSPPAEVTPTNPPANPPTPTPATKINLGQSIFRVDTSLKILNTSENITFLNNSGNFGSVISCVNSSSSEVTIANNSATMEFSQNFSTCSGGVIHNGKQVTFSDNTGNITFSGNSCANSLSGISAPTGQTFAFGDGGAICIPNGSLILKNNSGSFTFSYNATPGSAGAVYAQTCTISNAGPLTFHSNTAAKNGGAICAKVFELNSYGMTTFKNNRATSGGAIFVSPTIGNQATPPTTESTLKISAYKNTISFDGNMLSSVPGVRNAITVKEGGKILALQAQSSSKLLFYDPITHELPTTTQGGQQQPATLETITINNSGFSGSVVFSAENLSLGESLIPANKTSTLLGNVQVNDGELRITQNAIVNVLGFTASTGRLTLGSGGALGVATTTPANTPAAESFTIGKLGVDILSFLSPNFSSATIAGPSTTTGAQTPTTTLTGSLELVYDDDYDLYDNSFLQTSTAIPAVNLTGTGTITKDAFTPGEIPVSKHYGYQGSWSSTWTRPLFAPTPSGTFPGGAGTPPANMLYVLWTPSPQDKATYIFAPERRTELVTNTLWMSFLASKAFSDALQETLLAQEEGVSIALRGIGNYIHQGIRQGREGYSGRFGGYQATLAMRYPDDATVGMAFGQLYGKANAHPYSAKVSESMTLCSFFGRFPIVTEKTEVRLSWEAEYEYTRNHLTTTYTTPNSTRQSQGNWHNNTFHVVVAAEHPFLYWCKLTNRLAEILNLTGFISADFLGGWQAAFTETGDLARSFSRGAGYNVSLPIGCSTQVFSPFKKAPSTLTLKVAYTPDIFRVSPHTVVSIVSNQESTEIFGANPSRHGIFVQIHNLVSLASYTKAFLDYTLENKRGYTHQRVSTGLHRKF